MERRRTNLLAQIGWVLYGLGGKATSTVVFLIGPLMLANTARFEFAEADAEEPEPGSWALPRVLPSSVPSLAIAVALLAQCLAAPLLALLADRYGLRRSFMAAHVALGLTCNVMLGLTDTTTPVVVRAALLAALYYSMALAWMFQNALLPSVATAAQRPTTSLVSAGLSNLGAALFLLVQYKIVGDGSLPGVASLTGGPSDASLDLVCLIAAAIWFATAIPSLLLLSTLHSEPLAPEVADVEADGVSAELITASSTPRPLPRAGVAAGTPKMAVGGAAPSSSGDAEGDRDRVRVGIAGALASIRRLRQHKHAARFVLAQTLYLTAATSDGTSGSLFGQEVVGLPVARIVRLALFGAVAGAVGSVVTAVLARVFGARATLCGLMSLPPLLLLYTSLILTTEAELLVVGMLRAFVAGGVGFHGLNRGVFSQMVPVGREAEFFGV
jgi:UMF1 family MFS transporter